MDSKISTDNNYDYYLDVNQAISVKDGEFSCYLCNATYEKDLQLAAELGKTLLERNKELETALKSQQNVIEDQSQEIEYLTKQTAALKEVNSSRIKIYEQLEISIQDLEHANVTLSQQSATDKKHIKNLLETIQSLENKCDELQHTLDKTTVEFENEKRQLLAKTNDANESDKDTKSNNAVSHTKQTIESCTNCSEILTQLQETKAANVKEQRIIDDLRDQLSLVLQENDYLRNQVDNLQRKEDEMKSVQEELATMEQIRLGNLCKRCLRSTVPTEDCSSADEMSILMTNEDDDDIIVDIPVSDFFLEKADNGENPYRMLVEKYEALCKMQEQQRRRPRPKAEANGGISLAKPKLGMSLQDELRMTGGYYDGQKQRYRAIETDSEAEEEPVVRPSQSNGKVTETNADDVYHKSTQTEVLVGSLPGSFLCRISDGNDCQFSIYDDASPVESRFRKTPEYRHLFREIFAVLKRAAEAKDEGESLPLLDDRLPAAVHNYIDNYHQPKVPPVTPAREEQPFIAVEEEVIEQVADIELDEKPVEEKELDKPQTSCDIMEQLAAGVKLRDSKRERRMNAVHHHASPSPSPCSSRSTSKKRAGSKARRKRERLTDSPSRSRERHQQKSNKPIESMTESFHVPDVVQRPNPHKERPVSMFGFCGGSSSASKEVAKLKLLEKSYAEVLRMGRKKSTSVSKISIS